MKPNLVKTSKFLSLILRHKPENIGIELSSQGWVNVETLIKALNEYGKSINRELLDEIVYTNDKQRFAYSPDGLLIRANQGHSIEVDLELDSIDPPQNLYHGTAEKYIIKIRKHGLVKKNRQYVHLSALKETAFNVGKRHGKPVILMIEAEKMRNDGYSFYLSKNGVWLVDHVPYPYIEEIK